MTPIPFPEMNTIYKAPKDWDEAANGPCADLPVQRDEDRQTVTSCWQPSAADCQAIYGGAKVYLTVYGDQPAVMLEVR